MPFINSLVCGYEYGLWGLLDLGLNPGLATYMLCDLRLLSLSEPQFPISKIKMIRLSKEAHFTMAQRKCLIRTAIVGQNYYYH